LGNTVPVGATDVKDAARAAKKAKVEKPKVRDAVDEARKQVAGGTNARTTDDNASIRYVKNTPAPHGNGQLVGVTYGHILGDRYGKRSWETKFVISFLMHSESLLTLDSQRSQSGSRAVC
jgi:hypothetical protein